MNGTFLASSLSVSVTTGCTDHGGGQPDYSYWGGGGKRRRRFFRPRLACSLFSAEDCKRLGVWACSGYHLLRVHLASLRRAALYTAVHGATWPKKPTWRSAWGGSCLHLRSARSGDAPPSPSAAAALAPPPSSSAAVAHRLNKRSVHGRCRTERCRLVPCSSERHRARTTNPLGELSTRRTGG